MGSKRVGSLYGLVLPEGVHRKFKIAVASEKVDGRWIAGYMRYFFKRLLLYQGVAITKADEEGLGPLSIVLSDEAVDLHIIESLYPSSSREKAEKKGDTLSEKVPAQDQEVNIDG